MDFGDILKMAKENGVDLVSILSATLAVGSFLLNSAVVRRQGLMQAEALKAQMDADVVRWAEEAIDAISEGVWLMKERGVSLTGNEVRANQGRIAKQLSSIADKGRLFFPNLAPEAQGADKEAAYRGFRPPILDTVIFAFYEVDRMDHRALSPDLDAARFLTQCRRALVSEIQRSVDPRGRSKMMKKLALRGEGETPGFEAVAALAGDLEARHPGTLERFRDAAWIEEMRRHAAAKTKK